ncbi:MAG: Vms1/Ankzf1 family peptidyl-tRNA hydrolase [Methanothrix soehngenii]|nr:Vms1/Ankzf1 family peptidyl-tRNA hydrolase [Methanothrix soehngenii]
MVDLFGKKKLEDRISELEEAIAVREREKEELMRTLQKREEKIKRLASANQEANLALKAMEQKTATMVTSSPEKMETERPKARLPEAWMPDNRELDLLIQRLQGFRSPREDLLVYAFPGSLPEDADIPPQIRRAAMEIKTHRGGIIIYCPQLFALQFIPPFPIKERGSWEGSSFQLSLIEEMMNTPALVVSAHAGSTFLGVALSREGFAVHQKVETQVKEKHSKGGWSQKRFERLREEDIKNHLDAVQEKLEQLESKYGSIVKYAVLGGEEGLIRQIAPSIGLPLVERRLKQHDEKDPDSLLGEVYGFTCYRIEINVMAAERSNVI